MICCCLSLVVCEKFDSSCSLDVRKGIDEHSQIDGLTHKANIVYAREVIMEFVDIAE